TTEVCHRADDGYGDRSTTVGDERRVEGQIVRTAFVGLVRTTGNDRPNRVHLGYRLAACIAVPARIGCRPGSRRNKCIAAAEIGHRADDGYGDRSATVGDERRVEGQVARAAFVGLVLATNDDGADGVRLDDGLTAGVALPAWISRRPRPRSNESVTAAEIGYR